MIYDLDIEINGVELPGAVKIDENGAIDSLAVRVGKELVDLTDLLKNQDLYNAIERDYLAIVANQEV